MVSIDYREALSEIDDILNHLDVSILEKIPLKFKDFVRLNKSKTYIPNFYHNKKLSELPIKEKTRRILAVIYMNFLCNENEKKEYIKVLKENEINKQKYLRIKYNPNDLFKRKERVKWKK